MLPVQPSSAGVVAAIPSSTIHLTPDQRRELRALWSEIAYPKGEFIDLKRLPPEVCRLAEQMNTASSGNQIAPFFAAAIELQTLVPDVFEGYFEMIFEFLKRGIQRQEDVAYCRDNLALICSLIKPEDSRENEVSKIIAERNLHITQNVTTTKQILGDLSDSYFWLNQSAFLMQSCDGQEMQQLLLGISKELDLIVYLKLGNFSEIAKILGEVRDEYHLGQAVPTLSRCIFEIKKFIEDPHIIKQILEQISTPERKNALIFHLRCTYEKNTDLVLALAGFTDDPVTQAGCYGTACSSYLESKKLSLAVEAWKQVHQLNPGTLLDSSLAEKCVDLALELKDSDCAHEIVALKKDDEFTLKMIGICLKKYHLLSVAAKALETISDQTVKKKAHVGMFVYHLLKAGLREGALNEVLDFLDPRFEQNPQNG